MLFTGRDLVQGARQKGGGITLPSRGGFPDSSFHGNSVCVVSSVPLQKSSERESEPMTRGQLLHHGDPS